eukprot:5024088-Alexandrium_andersonii.AAC.1
MSASLVGSEMCIRDSKCERKRTQRHASACATGTSKRTQAHTHKRRPVSYTHLTLPTICSV